MSFNRCCSSCKHLSLPDLRTYYAADSETREQMFEDAWCLKHDSEPAPGVSGCPDHEPAEIIIRSVPASKVDEEFKRYLKSTGACRKVYGLDVHPGWREDAE